MTERPVIRDIKYEGAKSVSTSDILDRFKERKVGLTVESMYDPNVVDHAAIMLKDLVAARAWVGDGDAGTAAHPAILS